jgi:hypothetical protein
MGQRGFERDQEKGGLTFVTRSRAGEQDRRDSRRLYSEGDLSVLGFVDDAHAAAEFQEDLLRGDGLADHLHTSNFSQSFFPRPKAI